MPRLPLVMLVSAAVLGLSGAFGCTGAPGPSDGGDPADGCASCSDDELCWYEYDIDADANVYHCAAWPAGCDADRTCSCINDQLGGDDETFCDQFGAEQNSNACEVVDDRPQVYCEVNLG